MKNKTSNPGIESINRRVIAALKNVLGILIAFIALFIILSLSTDSFLTSQNLFNVIRQITVNLFLTCGMTFVVLIGGIDLSMSGGIGSIGGAIIGSFFIGIITNGMNLIGIESSWQYVVKGTILLLAVYLDNQRKSNK